MFRPSWRGGTDRPAVQGPPILRINIVVSPRLRDLLSIGQLRALGEAVLTEYDGNIHQFVNGQRQIAGKSDIDQYGNSTQFIGLDVSYQLNQGTEIIDLVAYPENAPGLSEVLAPLTFGSSFEIDSDFNGWPIRGWQYHAAGGAGFYAIVNYGNYYYDPLFVPQAPGFSDPSSADTPPDPPTNAPPDDKIWTGGTDPGGTAIELTDIGGSGVCVEALSGLQYWEVAIKELPTGVPASFSFPKSGAADGSFYQDITIYDDPTIEQWSWPTDLNTWYTPAIGLVPAEFVDPSWKKNKVAFQGVIGLDPDPTPAARTIGGVRTSRIDGAWSSNAVITSGDVLTATGGTLRIAWFVPGGGTQTALIGDASYPCISTTSPPTGTQFWNPGDVVCIDNQYLCVCIGNSATEPAGGILTGDFGPKAGPSAADCASWVSTMTPSLTAHVGFVAPPFQAGNVWFTIMGIAGSGLITNGSAGSTQFYDYFSGSFAGWQYTGTIVATPGGTTSSPGSGMKPFGDVFQTPDAFDGTGALIETGLNAVGRRFPVFKGRADNMATIAAQQDVSISDLNNGCWTGVDLGDIQVNDTIMIATNTSTREVWFGRNGQWYDASGPSTHKPGSSALTATTYMDGDKTVKYYPACSFRVGPTKLSMRFGASQKYLPPVGFTSYGTS